MSRRRTSLRTAALLTLCAVAFGSVGCSTLRQAGRTAGRYLKYRAEDCADTVDIGLTFTRKPRLAVYGCFASVWCLGYANLDARFLGVGGGWVGSVKLKANCRGMSYTGREQIIWSKNARWRHYSHPMGLDAVLAGTRIPPPAYFPACTHYIHVGPVGAVANLRYAEMLDLILGFTTFDLACDDGLERGDWFFYD